MDGAPFPLRFGVTAVIVRGDTTPATTNTLTPPAIPPAAGSIFQVRATVATPSLVASGVQMTPTVIPSGLTLTAVQTTRHDGVPMPFHEDDTSKVIETDETNNRTASATTVTITP